MEIWQAFILGILQGLTEFLPVSSSTHLALMRTWMDLKECPSSLYFDLICHAGTLLSALWILRRDVFRIFVCKKSFMLLGIALLPLVPAYFLLKPLRILLHDQRGAMLLATGTLLFLASRKPKTTSECIGKVNWRHMLAVGAMQSLAILPGISRSGSTIATARLLGWSWQEATRFSFLLAIPTILGGSLLETMKLTSASIPWNLCLIGFFASFVVGLGSLRLLFWILERKKDRPFLPFAWYCLLLGSYLLLRS